MGVIGTNPSRRCRGGRSPFDQSPETLGALVAAANKPLNRITRERLPVGAIVGHADGRELIRVDRGENAQAVAEIAEAVWLAVDNSSIEAGYFDVRGSSDVTLYGADSLVNSPNGRGLIFDAAYLPFSHGGPTFWPWANAQIGVSYTHYLQLFGGNKNFDGAGHNATGNDTAFLYAWILF